jgi:hypothetical protein
LVSWNFYSLWDLILKLPGKSQSQLQFQLLFVHRLWQSFITGFVLPKEEVGSSLVFLWFLSWVFISNIILDIAKEKKNTKLKTLAIGNENRTRIKRSEFVIISSRSPL